MKKLIILFVIVQLAVNGMAQLIPGLNGDGTQSNPVQITSLSDLQALSLFVRGDAYTGTDATRKNTYGKYFKLMQDIDMSADLAFVPIGGYGSIIEYEKCFFAGAFDGNAHIISNLTIDIPSTNEYGAGLFGNIDNALIENLTLDNVNVFGYYYVGGLCGFLNNSSTIRNCSVAGRVSGMEYNVGGLCGQSGSIMKVTVGGQEITVGGKNQILNCSSTAVVSGSILVGGLCGGQEGSTIKNCYAIGNVTGRGGIRIGGLIGENEYASVITNSYAKGNVVGGNGSGRRFYVAGFCGDNSTESVIKNCYATGSVTGYGSETGGFCGINYRAEISQCFATGSVEGRDNVGGFCGANQANGLITDCYATGAVGTSYGDASYENMGGFCGEIGSSTNSTPASIRRCYATGSVLEQFNSSRGGFSGRKNNGSDNSECYYLNTNTTDVSGGIPKTATEMKALAFVNLLNNSEEKPWKSDVLPNVNNGFPLLAFYADSLPNATSVIQLVQEKNHLRVSSNPVLSGQSFRVETANSSQLKEAKIEVYNITGQLIEKIDVIGTSTDIMLHVAPGIYILKLQQKTAKIVVR